MNSTHQSAYATWKTPVVTPSNKVAEISKPINVPIKELWAFVSQPGTETHCYPGIEWVRLEGHGLGSYRRMRFDQDSHSSYERLELYDPENHALAWRILEPALGAKICHGHIRLAKVDESTTNLIYTGTAEEWTDESTKDGLEEFLKGLYTGTINGVESKTTT